LQHKVRRGSQILVKDIRDTPLPYFGQGATVRVISSEGELIAIARAEMGYEMPGEDEAVAFRLLRVFQTNGGGMR